MTRTSSSPHVPHAVGRRAVRACALGLGVVVLVPAVAGPAVAADRSYRTDGKATGADLTVLGTPVLSAAIATALDRATSAGVLAEGTAVGLAGAGTSTARRTTDGTSTSAMTCATPSLSGLGLPASVAGAVTLGAACRAASAKVVGTAASSTSAAQGVTAKVSAEALAKVLTDLVVPTLTSTLSAVQGPVTTVTAQLTAAVGTVCATVPAPADAVCTAALADLQMVGKPTAQQLVTAITKAIATALKGVDLLTLDLGSSATSVTTTSTDSVSSTRATGVSVTSPSLAFLLKAITAAVTTVLTDYVHAVGDALRNSMLAKTAAGLLPGGASLVGTAADAVEKTLAPAAATAVTTIVDALTGALPFLLSDDPLLTVKAGDDRVTASVDRTTGALGSSADVASVKVTLGAALATFLMVPATTTVAAGQDLALFAGTPLASRIAVGSSKAISATRDGIKVSGRTADGVSLQLLTTVMGGVGVTAAGVSATAGSALVPVALAAPVAAPELPHTGGVGPAGVGLALMAGTGVLLAVRRRRTV